MKHGLGKLKQKEYFYNGNWKADKYHGKGVSFQYEAKNKLNCYYIGDFEEGMKNGKGKEAC